MKFFVSSSNHEDFIGCGDHLTYIRNALSQAGYSAALTQELVVDAGTVNILLEFFNPKQAAILAQAHRQHGLRFALVVSEVVTGRSFNDFATGASVTHYMDRNYWQKRFDCFMQVAPLAEAIWCLSDYQLDGYRKLLPGKRIATLPLCFDPVEAAAEQTLSPAKDIDVAFFGLVTPYRKETLAAIGRHVYVAKGLPKPILSDIVRRSRICLHLGLSRDWPYTSNMRHHALLCRQAYVLSEASRLPGELDPFVDICARDDLGRRISELLEQPDLPGLAHRAQARYAQERPPAPAISDLVAKSFEAR